jgi:pimeloyl-ACP methyl ester carboxylesterase
MRSFFISMPPNEEPPSRVLLYLHGFGDAFNPLSEEQAAAVPEPRQRIARLGAHNLFNEGVPLILGQPAVSVPSSVEVNPDEPPPFTLPVFDSFLTIAPQQARRPDMHSRLLIHQMLDGSIAFARTLVAEPKIAVMGFSMGGFAAFLLAERRPEVRAVVALEAAPAEDNHDGFAARISRLATPFWAFHTDYAPHSRFYPIAQMHRLITVPEVPFGSVPQERQCKTFLASRGTDHEAHTRVCNEACRSEAVYRWMMRYL